MPFQFQPYRSDLDGSIGELLARRGDIRANAARQSGDAQARAAEISGHGKAQIIGSIVNGGQQAIGGLFNLRHQRQQAQAEAPMRELAVRERLAKIAEIEDKLRTTRATEQEAAAAKAAVKEAMAQAGGDPTKAAAVLQAGGWLELSKNLLSQAPKPPEGVTLSPGQVRFEGGQQVASVPAATPEPKTYPVVVPGPDGKPVRKLFTEADLAKGVQEYRVPTAPSGGAKFWIMRDGKALRVSENEYRPGDMPASTREQGRSVTSGDAADLSDFDTSLDDLKVLRAAISSAGATGVQAQIGAAIPPWVTDLTGWGTDAKKKQALIDRVKQVIGKTLEGGVLRKEDELKYEKILPTVKDPNAIVLSKLDGLDTAIAKRKGRRMDALEDSNYDVSKYRAREAIGAPGGDVNTAVVVQAPDGMTYTFPNSKAADDFKRAAGIP